MWHVAWRGRGCVGVGGWSSEHTWYPGYAWRVCVCPQCGQQLGWMFEPEGEPEELRWRHVNTWLHVEHVELHLHACVCRNLEKPSEAGFYAIIVNRVIDESLASSITMTTGLKNEGKYWLGESIGVPLWYVVVLWLWDFDCIICDMWCTNRTSGAN